MTTTVYDYASTLNYITALRNFWYTDTGDLILLNKISTSTKYQLKHVRPGSATAWDTSHDVNSNYTIPNTSLNASYEAMNVIRNGSWVSGADLHEGIGGMGNEVLLSDALAASVDYGHKTANEISTMMNESEPYGITEIKFVRFMHGGNGIDAKLFVSANVSTSSSVFTFEFRFDDKFRPLRNTSDNRLYWQRAIKPELTSGSGVDANLLSIINGDPTSAYGDAGWYPGETLYTIVNMNEMYPVTAASSGDPYIHSLCDQSFWKLPDKAAIYRFAETDTHVVNAQVEQLSEQEKQNILMLEPRAEVEGYFFSNVSVHNKLSGDTTIVNTRDLSSPRYASLLSSPKPFFCTVQGNALYRSLTVEGIVDLMSFNHPQILTGLQFKGCVSSLNSGLVHSLCDSTTMEVETLYDVKPMEVKQKEKKDMKKKCVEFWAMKGAQDVEVHVM